MSIERITIVPFVKFIDSKLPDEIVSNFSDTIPDSIGQKTIIESDKDGQYIDHKGIGRINILSVREMKVPYTKVVTKSTTNSKGTIFKFETELTTERIEKVVTINLIDFIKIGFRSKEKNLSFFNSGEKIGYSTFVRISTMIFSGFRYSINGGEMKFHPAPDLIKALKASK